VRGAEGSSEASGEPMHGTPPERRAHNGEVTEAAAERHENPAQQLDRNWTELLQEVRVTQTGVQLLTGFLLTLPFQQRFTSLDDAQQRVYLADVALAVSATTLLVAPVLTHRLLFRAHRRSPLVRWAHRCALTGAFLFGAALVGVGFLIFDIVAGVAAGVAFGICTAGWVFATWVLAPWRIRRSSPADQDG
jgi:hypothetical protein